MRASRRPLAAAVRAYLWTITWGPAALAVAASLILGLHLKDMWGSPMWSFIGLFVLADAVGPITTGGLQRFAMRLGVHSGRRCGCSSRCSKQFGSYLMRKPTRGQFPGRELAAAVEQRWHEAVGRAPLAIVAGDVWLAGNVAFYAEERPSVFIDADPAKSPWITPAALVHDGAVLIWQAPAGPPPWLDRWRGPAGATD